MGSDESNLQLAEASNHRHPDLLNQQAFAPQLLPTVCFTCPGTVEPGTPNTFPHSTSFIKYLVPISVTTCIFLISEALFFLKKRSVFGVTLHAANTEHKEKFGLFVRN